MYMTASMPMPHASPMLPWRSGPSGDWDHLRLPDHNHTPCPCHPLGPLRCPCFPRAFLHRPGPAQMHRPSLPASPRPCSDAQASHKHSYRLPPLAAFPESHALASRRAVSNDEGTVVVVVVVVPFRIFPIGHRTENQKMGVTSKWMPSPFSGSQFAGRCVRECCSR